MVIIHRIYANKNICSINVIFSKCAIRWAENDRADWPPSNTIWTQNEKCDLLCCFSHRSFVFVDWFTILSEMEIDRWPLARPWTRAHSFTFAVRHGYFFMNKPFKGIIVISVFFGTFRIYRYPLDLSVLLFQCRLPSMMRLFHSLATSLTTIFFSAISICATIWNAQFIV